MFVFTITTGELISARIRISKKRQKALDDNTSMNTLSKFQDTPPDTPLSECICFLGHPPCSYCTDDQRTLFDDLI